MIIHTKYERTSVLQLRLNCPAFDKYLHCQLKLNRILSQKLWVHFLFPPPPITELRWEGTNSAETFCFHRLCSISFPHRLSPLCSAQDPRCSTRDSWRWEEEKRSARAFFHCSSVAEGSSCIRHARFTLETNLRPDHVSCAAGEAHGEMVGGANFGQPALQVSWHLDWNRQTGRQKYIRYKVT